LHTCELKKRGNAATVIYQYQAQVVPAGIYSLMNRIIYTCGKHLRQLAPAFIFSKFFGDQHCSITFVPPTKFIMNNNSATYSIPARFRRIENMHILFWLIKDLSWALLWRPIGIIMLVPTLTVAILITWQTRKIAAELFHNLAVVFWITANGYWMIVEFYGYDEELRIYTVIPFCIGLLFILTYYLYILPREKSVRASQ
jgi:hypothetical protein